MYNWWCGVRWSRHLGKIDWKVWRVAECGKALQGTERLKCRVKLSKCWAPAHGSSCEDNVINVAVAIVESGRGLATALVAGPVAAGGARSPEELKPGRLARFSSWPRQGREWQRGKARSWATPATPLGSTGQKPNTPRDPVMSMADLAWPFLRP